MPRAYYNPIGHGAHPTDAPVPVPYTSKMAQPLQLGQTINLHGKINEDAKRIEINLLQGAAEISAHAGQAVLHMNLRFDEGKLVYNSFTGGLWGKEERESLPIKAGENYDIRIRALEEFFEIRVNGVKVHEYKHRVPYTHVEYFQIKGDCTLNGIHWGGRLYTIPWETGFANGAGLQAGQKISLYAIPKGDRFNIDLIARNGDILFHWNPRFGDKAVVRNSCRGGTWEKEEREGPFPFKKNVGNDITIINEPYSIQILVDGHQIGTFQHRCSNPTEDYIGMRIEGEVDVTGVEFSKH